MEQKVKIEETFVNIGYVKGEFDEELELKVNQYKITSTFENTFEDSSTDQRNNRDSSIGFLCGDVKMEIESVKLEGIKEENKDFTETTIAQSYLKQDQQEYLESHLENYNRLCHIESGFQQKPTEEIKQNEGNYEIFECDICKKRYFHKSSLGEHIKNQHSNTSEEGYKCPECVYQTNSKRNLKAHLNSHSKPFECDFCKKKFSRNNLLNEHMRNQHTSTSKKERFNEIKQFECDICKKGYRQKKSLKEHINNQHSNTNEKAHKCPHCCYQTNRKRYLRHHIDRHKDVKPFECDICKIRYLHKNSLNEHMINQHLNTNEKLYKCTKCSYQSNMERHLKSHLHIHGDIRPFECYVCKKGFNQKNKLKTHMKTKHLTISKGEKCSDCSYEANCKEHLNTEIKLFECDVCKKKYLHKSSLKGHIRDQHSITNEKEYKCSECSYQTNYKSHFKQHLNRHNGIKPFECIVCNVRYTDKRSLKLHIKNKHSNKSEK